MKPLKFNDDPQKLKPLNSKVTLDNETVECVY